MSIDSGSSSNGAMSEEYTNWASLT
jgi:hypothetical protein